MLTRKLLSFALTSVVLIAVSLSGCRKENGIDNNQVIQTPYSLFVSDSSGGLMVTNDGEMYREIFKPDGISDRGLLVSGTNLLWAKDRLYLNEKNTAFNPTFNTLPLPANAKWSSMLLHSDKQKRVYVPSTIGSGIYYSEDDGKTWKDDTTTLGGGLATVSSFAETSDGILYAYDNVNHRAFVRLSSTVPWATQNNLLSPSGTFQLIGYQKTLVAYDYSGTTGAWYSVDTGKSWKQFTGIPTGERLRCAVAPFGDNLLIGSESGKVYRLDNGTFISSSGEGIESESIVRGLAAKRNIYKADANGNNRENHLCLLPLPPASIAVRMAA